MAVNKVVYGGETLVDLTEDTITAETLYQGITAHNKAGEAVVGTLPVKILHIGTTEPDNSLGNDGDVYVKLGSG